MARPFAVISLRLGVSRFVEGDTITLLFSSETKWLSDCLKKKLKILEKHEDLSNN